MNNNYKNTLSDKLNRINKNQPVSLAHSRYIIENFINMPVLHVIHSNEKLVDTLESISVEMEKKTDSITCGDLAMYAHYKNVFNGYYLFSEMMNNLFNKAEELGLENALISYSDKRPYVGKFNFYQFLSIRIFDYRDYFFSSNIQDKKKTVFMDALEEYKIPEDISIFNIWYNIKGKDNNKRKYVEKLFIEPIAQLEKNKEERILEK